MKKVEPPQVFQLEIGGREGLQLSRRKESEINRDAPTTLEFRFEPAGSAVKPKPAGLFDRVDTYRRGAAYGAHRTDEIAACYPRRFRKNAGISRSSEL